MSSVERGTCRVCGQELLRTLEDCWHPYTVERACPPEVRVDGVLQPEFGDGFLRPGRAFFVPEAASGCKTCWGPHGCTLGAGHAGTHRCDCCECEDHVRDHKLNMCVGQWPYYGATTRFFDTDHYVKPRKTEGVKMQPFISVDQLHALAKLGEAVQSIEAFETDYGEFWVGSIDVTFDGERIGRFVYQDDQWTYVEEAAEEE